MSTRVDTNLPFSVGVVNSEISSDVDFGVDVAADLGMSQIEIETSGAARPMSATTP